MTFAPAAPAPAAASPAARAPEPDATGAQPPALRPWWLRARFWLALGGLLVLTGVVVAFLSPTPGRDLDPRSPSKGGSKALASVLGGYGVAVQRTTSVETALAAGPVTVLVVEPDVYSARQLLDLAGRAGRLVLLEPDQAVLDALAPTLQAEDPVTGTVPPRCAAPGPRATGPVDLAGGSAATYSGPGFRSCYDGMLVSRGRIDVLGSGDLLRNDALSRRGVAALDVNLLSADRSATRLVWLLPGADAAGPGAPTVWDLFPAGAHRAFVWLFVTGVVVILWRGRRLGPPVPEPLPVVVRSAEVVEGHGRLYHRARARARAAAALRAGTIARLAAHLGFARDAGPAEVTALLPGTDPARTTELLAGAAPRDDANLLELAAGLRRLEGAAGVPPEGKDER